MTWPASAPEEFAPRQGGEGREGALLIRKGLDGSFSLWSEAFDECFHSGRGALREASETFLAPSQLERFQPGARLRVVEVCVGTGSNLALLLEACAARGIVLQWWGLELDTRPLALALSEPMFGQPFQPSTLAVLEGLSRRGVWRSPRADCQILWGDARQTLPALLQERRRQIHLVWHDAFSPRRCPQLWTVEVLAAAADLLLPEGRWLSFTSAAAVREALRLAGLHLVAMELQEDHKPGTTAWSGGTLASPTPLGPSPLWRQLTVMELDHLASGAGEPYRDPSAMADALTILSRRRSVQSVALANGTRASSSSWRRLWGVVRK